MNITNQSHSSEPAACQVTLPDRVSAVSLSISYGIVLLLAVTGNSLVINFARTNTRMKSNVFNLFLICMATADIIDVLFVVPMHWIFFFYGNTWIGGLFGAISCKMIYFLVDVSIFTSVLTLVAITMDRYFAICHISYTPLSRVRTRIIVVCIWTGSCLLSAIQLYKFKIVVFNSQSYCVPVWNRNDREKEELTVKYEMIIKFALSYGIPLSLMIVLYALIIRQLRRRLHSCVVEENQELQRQIAHQNRPLVEMFITLVTIFAICWFPVHVNHMLIAFDFKTYLCLPTAVPLVFYLLAHTNAAINPLLYFVFISGFRKELKRKVRGFWQWATTKNDSASNSTWISYFKSRSPSLRRQKHVQRKNRNNNETAEQNIEPNPTTPKPFLKTLNVDNVSSTNHGLSLEADMYLVGVGEHVHSQQDPSPPMPVERTLGIQRRDWAQENNSSHVIIRPSRSVNAATRVNRAYNYDPSHNNNLQKSLSLPWKFSTFV